MPTTPPRRKSAGHRLPYGRGSVTLSRSRLVFFYHVYRNLGRNFLMQPQRHLELAQRLDGLIQRNLAALDGVALLLQSVRDVLGCHRSEELIVLAGLLLNGHTNT